MDLIVAAVRILHIPLSRELDSELRSSLLQTLLEANVVGALVPLAHQYLLDSYDHLMLPMGWLGSFQNPTPDLASPPTHTLSHILSWLQSL